MSEATKHPYLIKITINMTGLSASYIRNQEAYGGGTERAMELLELTEAGGNETASASLQIWNGDRAISDALQNVEFSEGTITISFINEETGFPEYQAEFPIQSVSWGSEWAHFQLRNVEL
jgi:hypothetical protein